MRNPSPALASGSGSATGAVGKAQVTRCCSKVGLKRGAWTREEDEVLSSFIRREGEGKWRTLPKRAGLLRCGKSCRLRWMNYLRPSVKRGPIAPDEEDLILRLHRLLGNRWSLIAGRLPGRTDNEIKNYWNTHLSKKLISQGIDPRTHKPLNEDKPPSSLKRDKNDHASPVPAENPNPSPVQVQNTSSLGHPDVRTNSSMVIGEDIDNYCDGYNLDDGGDQWQTFDETKATALINGDITGDALEIGGMDCCTDDVFSSFLDSLINDDMFQKNSENNSSVCDATHDIDLAAASDFLVSEDPGFGNLPLWEPAVICSTTSTEENHVTVRSTNHMDKQL